MVLAFGWLQTIPSSPLPGLSPPTGCSSLPTSLASQDGGAPSLPVFPAVPGISACWRLRPSLFLHLLWFANPAAGLGEALIHHGAPCQPCQKAETERGTQHWNKPLHDPV